MQENFTAADVIHSLPERFRPDKAADYNARFHFVVEGEGGGDFTVIISNGQCRVQEGLNGKPDCTVNTDATAYVAIETGRMDSQSALRRGKIRVSGIAAMMEFTKLFEPFSQRAAETPGDAPALEEQDSRKPQNGPLQGLKIVDLTRLLPGPLATMMLADMGAEVIKVEGPNAPDYIRNFPPFTDGQSVNYSTLNRSKRSVAIDLYTDEGKEVLKQLIDDADVLIEQYRPGVMDQIGLGYHALSARNPELVFVSVSGYGQNGPYRDQAGHDLNYISISGLLSLNTDENGKPVIPGFQIADIAGGSYMAVNAVLAALYQRQQSGKGQHVDVAMMDGVMPLMSLAGVQYWSGGVQDKSEMQLSGGLANYNVYQCADGRYVALGALEPKFWQSFCQMVNRDDWVNRIADSSKQNMDHLKEELDELFKSKSRDEWLTLAQAYDCCLSPVNTLDEASQDPQLQHRHMISDQQSENGEFFKTFGTPNGYSHTPTKVAWRAPALGEDTLAVLQETGYEKEKIRELQQKEIVKLSHQ